MSTAVLSSFDFNIEELRQIQFRTVSPSRFIALGKKLHRAANVVRQNWKFFSPEEKSVLQRFAYDLLEPPSGADSLKIRFQAFLYMLFIKATGQEKDFCFCIDAMDCLIDNILDAIERDDPCYQQGLSDTLKELNDNPDSGKPIDANTRSEWLRQLSDKALDEV